MDGWPPNREFACPWLRRYVSMKWEKSPRVVLVLQDWGLADDESLKEAMKLLGERTGDRTIKAIFGIPRLKQAIASGSVCIMNAVWGLRRADKNKTGYLGDEVHRAAFPVWAAALKELSPTKVWLGGEWAKWPDLDWGKAEGGQRQIERWRKWAELPPSVGLQTKDFVKQAFCTIPHPSAWTFSFSDFVKDL